MTFATLRCCVRQVYGSALAALLPATVIGALQLGVELAYGNSLRAAQGPAIAYFILSYVVITIGACVACVVQTMNKAHETDREKDERAGLGRASGL